MFRHHFQVTVFLFTWEPSLSFLTPRTTDNVPNGHAPAKHCRFPTSPNNLTTVAVRRGASLMLRQRRVSLYEIAFPKDFDRILLLGRYRAPLEQARAGASGLMSLRDKLLDLPEPNAWITGSPRPSPLRVLVPDGSGQRPHGAPSDQHRLPLAGEP
jgi:hypothetical protein